MTKSRKFLLKTVYFFPFGFLIWMMPNGFQMSLLGISFIAGIAIALFFVFWNLFEYEKFDEIHVDDFLESQHTVLIDCNDANWNRVKKIHNFQDTKVERISTSESFIEYQIDQRIIDSVLQVEKVNDKIKMTIKRKYFGHLLDMAGNYRTLKKIVNQQFSIAD